MADSLRESTVADVGLRHPIRTPFERWPHGTDLVIAILSLALTLSMWTSRDELDMNTFTGVGSWLTAFIASYALLWRRSHAMIVHAFVIFTGVLVLLTPLADGIVAMTFTLYSVGRYEPNARASLLGVCIALIYLTFDLKLISHPSIGDTIAAGLAVLIWYFGRRMRFRGEYLRLLEERAYHLEREQHAEAERAVAAERTRIAREMHDVVAHQVSLMTVQAGAARTVTETDPAAAGAAMAAVESAGRQALTEMRGLLGVLRPAEQEDELMPQPGLGDIEHLIDQVCSVGHVVTLEQNGDLDHLSARYELTLYRLVQEALTNVLKHAGDAVNVYVSIEGDSEHIEVRVCDDGDGKDSSTPGGHGIVGMRERVELLGGTLTAGPTSGGFEVHSKLPRKGKSV
ncbi:MAG: sensor histidine kinase [Pseudomonadota bacterium]